MSTIAEVVQQHDGNVEALVGALVAREDQMRDRLMQAGMQFGLYPFIVSAVLLEVGLGTPPSEAEAQMIRRNYAEGMQALQQGRDLPGPPDEGSVH